MYQKFARALSNLHRGQRGMTGLETAIILIAFVTVASVLAYSVLSAGIFSAEKGKATVYSGLKQAQATMEIQGSVLGVADNLTTTLQYIELNVGLTIPDEKVDISALIINYFDDANEQHGLTRDTWAAWTGISGNWTYQKSDGSTERGKIGILEGDEIHTIRVAIPLAAKNLIAYDDFTIQVIPPTGASLTIKRTLTGQLRPVMDLK